MHENLAGAGAGPTDGGWRLTAETLLNVSRRRFWVVLVFAIVVPASALGWSLRQDKEYTATSQLLFRDPGFDQRLFGTTVLQPSRDPERQAATNVLLVSNRQVAVRTARAHGPRYTAKEIERKLKVASEGQADVISVS